MLPIFWKDTRRLWKEVTLTWALLAYLTLLDSQRQGYIPSFAEGWLNLLLPLAWSYLTALCVLQDAIPGDRQFWLTFPYRRTSLLGAKILFAGACIHLPYLISGAFILQARGFNPLQFIPHLLQTQLLLLLVVTLPSVALASVVRSAPQFTILALTVAGAALLIMGNRPLQPLPWLTPDKLRQNLFLLLLALLSAAVLWLQYQNRRTLLSRIMGFTGLLAAASLYLWFPLRLSAALESTLNLPVSIRALPPDSVSQFHPKSELINVKIPVELQGLPSPDLFRLRPLDITGPAASAFLSWNSMESPNYHLVVTMDRESYSRLATTPVTLTGHFLAEIHRNGTLTDITKFGHCNTSNVTGLPHQDDLLRITCESPNPFPQTRVILTDTATSRHWDELLGGGVTDVSYPRNTWLSPITRREAFFHLTSQDTTQPGSQWRAPVSILNHYRIEIEPQPLIGKALIEYQLPGIQLNKYPAQAAYRAR